MATPRGELDALKNPFRFIGRTVTGAATSVDDILRGIYRMGQGAVQDVERGGYEAADAVGIDTGARGQRVQNRDFATPGMLKDIGLSLANTVDAAGDLTVLPNLAMGRDIDEAKRQARERLQQLNDDPFMFGLEHIGNVALSGALVSKPAQLSVAASRGALSPTAAARGLVPVRGTGSRATARRATEEAASSGSNIARGAIAAEDIVGRPYRAMGRAAANSRTASLIRNPLDRTEAVDRFKSLWQQDEGALILRADAPEGRYNQLLDDIEDTQARLTYDTPNDPALRSRLTSLENEIYNAELDLQSQGIQIPESGRFTAVDVTPDKLETTTDFEWGESSDGSYSGATDFWEGMSSRLLRSLRDNDITPQPNKVDIQRYDRGGGGEVYRTNANGEVVGVLQVTADDINVSVDPQYRGQGIAKELISRAIADGLPLEQAIGSGNIIMSQYGSALTESFRQKAETGDFNISEGVSGVASDTPLREPEVRQSRNSMDELADVENEIVRTMQQLERSPEANAPRLNARLAELRETQSRITEQQRGFANGEVEQRWNADTGPDQYIEVMPDGSARNPRTGVIYNDTMAALDSVYFERVSPADAGPGGRNTEAIDMLRDLSVDNPSRLRDLFASEEGSISLGGRRTDNHIGPLNLLANEVGLFAKTVGESATWDSLFGADNTAARRIREQYRNARVRGSGQLADDVRDQFYDKDTPIGNQQLRRRWDPSRVERLLLRDLDNLRKGPQAERWSNLIDQIDNDPLTVRNAPGRAARVATGDRVVGQTLDPEGLQARITAVMNEAQAQAAAGNTSVDVILKEMLPGVDPMGLYLLGLNAVELTNNLPKNSLTSAFSDYVSMDRFADTNRRAQEVLRGTEFDLDSIENSRFRIPDDELSVDVNALPADARALFLGAGEQWRRYLAENREPGLISEGVITENGTRFRTQPNEPTRFSTALDDLPLTKDYRAKIRAAHIDAEAQRQVVDDIRQRVQELDEFAREAGPSNPERLQGLTRAAENQRKRLATEERKLESVAAKVTEIEDMARFDLDSAPASARNVLNYGRNVAPKQAAAIRAMADEGTHGDPAVLRSLADELEAIPQTIEDLNSADVYVAYLKDMKDRGAGAGPLGPTMGGRPVDTRAPGGTRRRGTALDLDYDRDFRARAYWQDAEFQSWFLGRQADRYVRNAGLAKNGRTRLLEAGRTEAEIAAMSPGQAQQALERLGVRTYQPDTVFGTGRKAPENVGALEQEWITPQVEATLMKAIQQPSGFERLAMQGVYDPALQTWKVATLPLRVAWQVNNTVGSTMLTLLAGKVGVADYPALMRASTKAVRQWNQGITDKIHIPLTQRYRAELTAKLNASGVDSTQRAAIQDMLDNDAIILSNEVLNDISSGGLTRGDFAWLNNSQFLRDIGASGNQNIFQQFGIQGPQVPGEVGRRGRNLRQTGREVVDMSYHVNETVDNMHRAMIYLDQIGKGNTPEVALSQVTKALGDYNKLTYFERKVVKRIYPFYPWMRHMTEVMGRSLKPENIQHTILFTHITNILGEPNEWEEMLPDYAGGHIYVGDDENGLPQFVSTRGANVFLDVLDPIQQPFGRGLVRPMSPFITVPLEQLTGVSNLTGRPFSTPGGAGSGDLPRPPLTEQIIRQIPQASMGRDIYRGLTGEPTSRYGTGEPNYFPGSELTEKTPGQVVGQYFGANVRSMDVEGMAQRDKVEEYRQEVARRRQEAQERRGRN